MEPDPRHHEKLVRVYLSAPTNAWYRPRMTVTEGRARIAIDVREELFHSAGAVHGSHYFKLLDDAAFFAVNSLVPDVFVLTVTFTVHLMRPVSSGTLVAEGEVVNRSARLFWADSVLRDGEGRQLGRGNGTFVRSKIALGPEIGYE